MTSTQAGSYGAIAYNASRRFERKMAVLIYNKGNSVIDKVSIPLNT